MSFIRPRNPELAALAERTGIPYPVLKDRHRAGYRGEALTRPVRGHTYALRAPPTALPATRLLNDERRALEDAARTRRETRQRRIVQLRDQLLAEIRQPLIDGSLLTDAERDDIRDRVMGCQRWGGFAV